MASLIYSDKKNYQQLELLKKVSSFTGMAIQGGSHKLYVAGSLISGISKAKEVGFESPSGFHYDSWTVTISSDYYSTERMKELLEIDC